MRAWSRWRLPLAVAALVCSYPALRHAALEHQGRTVPAAGHDHLRVVSWNLRNFPGTHDLDRLREHLDELAPAVLAAQEVRDPEALFALRPQWRWHTSETGGRHDQRLVFGWDPTRVDLHDIVEHRQLSMGGKVRPGLSAWVQPLGRNAGSAFRLVNVHLKATRDGLPMRRQQWAVLTRILGESLAPSHRMHDVLLVGDFNVAGGTSTPATAELRQLERVLASVGLGVWASNGGCTAYWEGSRRDSWWEPSRLDLAWSPITSPPDPDQRVAWSGAHCARHACDPVHASEHHPDPDLQGISDHCPVVIDRPGGSQRHPS
ncbi:MAG: hypothetical protein AAF799_14265 [Myxococcota bacterium]